MGEETTMPVRRHIVFLGDSIVDGHTSLLLLSQALRERGGEQPVLVNAGVGGNTLRQMRERATRDVLPHDPDTVCISAGVNDAHQGVAPEAFEADLVALFGFLREHRIVPVLATPTPLADDHYSPSQPSASRSRVWPSTCGTALVWAMIGRKFTSPLQRGTMWWCRWAAISASGRFL